MTLYLLLVCDGCATTRHQVPMPDHHAERTIRRSAGWPATTTSWTDDELVRWPPPGVDLCPACAALGPQQPEVESLPMFGEGT